MSGLATGICDFHMVLGFPAEFDGGGCFAHGLAVDEDRRADWVAGNFHILIATAAGDRGTPGADCNQDHDGDHPRQEAGFFL